METAAECVLVLAGQEAVQQTGLPCPLVYVLALCYLVCMQFSINGDSSKSPCFLLRRRGPFPSGRLPRDVRRRRRTGSSEQ